MFNSDRYAAAAVQKTALKVTVHSDGVEGQIMRVVGNTTFASTGLYSITELHSLSNHHSVINDFRHLLQLD